MSTQSGYKINNSQNVKSCKIKRSEADNLYKTLTGLIHKQCSPVLFAPLFCPERTCFAIYLYAILFHRE